MSVSSVETETTVSPAATAQLTRKLEAESVVQEHLLYAVGVGLVPIPLVDFLGVTALQVRLVKKLCDLYGVEFQEKRIKGFVSALIGGSLPAVAAWPLASMVQAIPVVGWTLGVGSMAILSGATTYAVGKVFINHFEDGGTILDFDTQRARGAFNELYEEGKRVVKKTSAKV